VFRVSEAVREDWTVTKLSLVPGTGAARRSFERLVRPHYEVLYRAAFRFTASRQDAEDLVQETCLRAWRNVARVAELDNPRTWLLCVMRRLFIDQTRRYERLNVRSLDAAFGDDVASDGPGPAESTEAELMARRVERCWRRLGREQRTLLALHDVEGYSLREIEQITGIKTGTIKSRLHRARVKLGRLMQARGDLDASAPAREQNHEL